MIQVAAYHAARALPRASLSHRASGTALASLAPPEKRAAAAADGGVSSERSRRLARPQASSTMVIGGAPEKMAS
jgi:hypothetical protein